MSLQRVHSVALDRVLARDVPPQLDAPQLDAPQQDATTEPAADDAAADELRKQRQRERYRVRRADPEWVQRHREMDRRLRREAYEGRREAILARARERRIEKRIEQLREKAAQPPAFNERRAGRPRLDGTRRQVPNEGETSTPAAAPQAAPSASVGGN